MLTRSSEWILNPMPYAGNYVVPYEKKNLLDCDTVTLFFLRKENTISPGPQKERRFQVFYESFHFHTLE